ncbi:HNH endonuclease signature motif containing protein [Glaciihabitans sp. GrIS 2.15]|uniref:HNH endonuclease signature motif containing protein n=1 Tax=Glaciihabitans sp. GrIS 2.15 TaxID=3071710 RepID=UPI002DFF91FA|nr:hypothetical protein [Glaciihabitans sp. GrIS 2.15]
MQRTTVTAAPPVDRACADATNRVSRTLIDSELMHSTLTDSELMFALAEQFQTRRATDATIVRLIAEVTERSRPSLGRLGLAHRMMDSSAASSLIRVGRIGRQEAARFVRVATATSPTLSITGETIAPRYPRLAAALDDGTVGMDAAAAIVTNLDQASPRAHPDDVAYAEEVTVDFACTAPADLVRTLAVQCRDRLDTDGIEPREEELIRQRKLSITELANGMHRMIWDMDPLTAASVRGYVDGYVESVFHTGRRNETGDRTNGDGADAIQDLLDDPPTLAEELRDPRTRANIASDAVLALFGHVSNCAFAASPLPKTTLVVRLTLDDLLSGLGEARLDGIDHPISAGTARRMAAEAGIIPIVMGGPSEVLDLGREQRLFNRKHRLAIGETYSACAGCGRPASWTELHHIDWFVRDGGLTNLKNAIPLCSSDHHAVHANGWEVSVRGGVAWFIPPSSIDVFRTPRRGSVLPRLEFRRRQ